MTWLMRAFIRVRVCKQFPELIYKVEFCRICFGIIKNGFFQPECDVTG